VSLDLNDVVVFTEVVSSGSFTAAGKKLDLPTSAVSRRVARLEEQLGYKLLHRTTRSIGLTDAGRVYYERTARIVRDLEAANRALDEAHARIAGLVRITAPPDDNGVLWRLLSGFLQEHTEVDVEILHTLEYVDLVEEGMDLAMRGGSPPDSSVFTAHRLFDSRMVLVASPAYLERHGTPQDLDDLPDHYCVGMDGWAPHVVRRLADEDRSVRVDVRNRVKVNRLDTARQAALDGLGIAPLVAFNCASELESGALVEVLRGALPGPAAMWLVYPSGRRLTKAARALVEHIIAVAPDVAPKQEVARPLPPQ